jgi:hypothetical protein
MYKTPRVRKRPAGKVCAVCVQIRRFLIGAGFLLAMLWAKPDWNLPKGLDYTTLVGDLFLGAFVLLLGWKYYRYRQDNKRDDQ